MKSRLRPAHRASALAAFVLSSALVGAQTQITPAENRYTPAQDVEMGRQAAAEVRKQLPLMRDEEVTSYVQDLGRRLTAAIPEDLRHPEFQYTFDVVNVKEINAFALPGGPMFVNRGMVEAAKTEGEVAGVMAHELSHVVLRHGTAQASKATKYEVGQLAGAVLGAIVGGGWGKVISTGYPVRPRHRVHAVQPRIRTRSGPRGRAHHVARRVRPARHGEHVQDDRKESGSGGPQWLSDHPDPGDRYEYITREAKLLRVEAVAPVAQDTRRFEQVQNQLRRLPAALSTEQATRNASKGSRPTGTSARGVLAPSGRVEAPSSSTRTYTAGNVFRVTVPANWHELQDTNTVIYAPDGGYGDYDGQTVFTHGIEMGVARNETHDLQTATNELVDSLARSNPNLSRPSGFDRVSISGRRGLRTVLTNRSEATGQRRDDRAVHVTTTRRDSLLRRGGRAAWMRSPPTASCSTGSSTRFSCWNSRSKWNISRAVPLEDIRRSRRRG